MRHLILSTLRKIATKLRKPNIQNRPLAYINDANQASHAIYTCLTAKAPCMIARFGSVELDVVTNYLGMLRYRNQIKSCILGETPKWWWEKSTINHIRNNAGFINPTTNKLKDFSKMMLDNMKLVDILGSWKQEEVYFEKELCHAQKIRLRYLEPFWSEQPWTLALKGKRVLVIHPFAETIKKQYAKRAHLFNNPNILPDFKALYTIKAVQSIGGECEYKDWFEALQSMERQMDSLEYDICLIGCGAYGFPLAAHAKRTGHKAIHLGGALQLLFGIKGKRWFTPSDSQIYKQYKRFPNEYWVSPSAEEKPKAANSVEGGCYW